MKIELFYKAASEGAVHRMKKPLKPSVVFNVMQGDGLDGQTALHIAALMDHRKIVHFLLSAGADVITCSRDVFG